MTRENNQRLSFLEKILDHLKVAVTCVDADGIILYANPPAKRRPSKTPRNVGTDIKDCHRPETNEKIDAIFKDFKNGRLEPHHYVSTLGGEKSLVTMIPMFQDGVFSGCVSQVHPLNIKGPEKSFL